MNKKVGILGTGSYVPENIKSKNTDEFDISVACSGFIYGITIAKQFVQANMYKNVLVIYGWILSTYLGSDGSGADVLNIPAGGSKLPASKNTIENNLHSIQMIGNDAYKFAVMIMGESTAKRLKLGMDKVYVNLDKYGNMSAASIPVALDKALRSGKINAIMFF